VPNESYDLKSNSPS